NNSANNITVKNCLLDAGSGITSATQGIVCLSLSASGSTGNSFITLDNNKIGDAANFVTNCIYSDGSSSPLNHDNTITNNEIFNFNNGIYATSSYNGGNWNISNNSFYNNLNNTTNSN